MKILLTGSRGFVGIYLSKKLNELGNNVVGIDKNHFENKYLNQFFQYNLSNFKFNEIKDEPAFKNLDILIHCAAAKGDYKELSENVIKSFALSTEMLDELGSNAFSYYKKKLFKGKNH